MIHRAFVESPIGFWTITVENQLVTSIDYKTQQPHYEISEDVVLQSAKRQLTEYFDGKRQSFNLPLSDNLGTEFQRQVWQLVSSIPLGKTISYTDLAIQLGNLKAIRAVGLANGKNPFPIVVPCHRVIGRDNSLIGYAHGVTVKKWLLEHEGVLAFQTSLF